MEGMCWSLCKVVVSLLGSPLGSYLAAATSYLAYKLLSFNVRTTAYTWLNAFLDRVHCRNCSYYNTFLDPNTASEQTKAGRRLVSCNYPVWLIKRRRFQLWSEHCPANRRHHYASSSQSWWQSRGLESSYRNLSLMLNPSTVRFFRIPGSVQGKISPSTVAPFQILADTEGAFVHRTSHLCAKSHVCITIT